VIAVKIGVVASKEKENEKRRQRMAQAKGKQCNALFSNTLTSVCLPFERLAAPAFKFHLAKPPRKPPTPQVLPFGYSAAVEFIVEGKGKQKAEGEPLPVYICQSYEADCARCN